jgi:hypothetical protein
VAFTASRARGQPEENNVNADDESVNHVEPIGDKFDQVFSEPEGAIESNRVVENKTDEYCQVDACVVSGSYQGTTKYFWIEPDDELVCDTVDNPNNLG